MINYYKVLNVSEFATQNEIEEAYKKLTEKYHFGESEEIDEKLKLIEEAYSVLSYVECRKEYDKEMFSDAEEFDYEDDEEIEETPKNKLVVYSKSKAFLRKHGFVLCTCALAAGGLIIGFLIGRANSSKQNEKPNPSIPTNPPVTSTPNPEKPVETPVVEEGLLSIENFNETENAILNAENFEQTVQAILADNQSKGLNIDPIFIKSALLITNIDYLSQEDIKEIAGNDFNIIEEITNMYNYTSAVGTHNNNLAFGNIEGEYIPLFKLAFDKEDRKMLYELDVEFVDLVNDLFAKKMNNVQFQDSFKYIKEFYLGNGYINTNDSSYSLYSLTSGAGLLSEQYWPMLSVIYASSEFITDENMIDIKSLSSGIEGSDAIINGSRWLGSIINHEALCIDNKTLTKTQ